jgi:hypothetical protein
MSDGPSVGTAQDATSGFWATQFAERVTRPQYVFDVVFGIVVPALCLLFDPVVFSAGDLVGAGVLHDYRVFGYATVAVSFVLLLLWLVLGPRVRSCTGALAGGLFAAAAFAAGVGLRLLPLSVVFTLAVIGVLGFTPFLTAFVFLRNGVRALRAARCAHPALPVALSAWLGGAAVLGAPALLQLRAARMSAEAITQLLTGGPQEQRQALGTLTAWSLLVDTDQIVRAYEREPDSERRARLKQAYGRITGDSIDSYLARIND